MCTKINSTKKIKYNLAGGVIGRVTHVHGQVPHIRVLFYRFFRHFLSDIARDFQMGEGN